MSKKLTTTEFIEKSIEIHGDKYDYSNVEYLTSHTKVKIICPEHGEFEQKPNKHLQKQGCPSCGKTKILGNSDFIKKAIKIHNNFYDYSLTNYTHNKNKVIIICPIHGEFEQIAYNHLQGCGCLKCSGRHKHDTESFIKKSISIHGDRYDYSKVEYVNKSTKVKIICHIHGEFEQTPNNHFNSKIGCNMCKLESTESKPCSDISILLKKFNFEKEKRFENCKNSHTLPFDFYIDEFNLCIEYDGIQHFKSIEFWGGESGFMKIQENDNIKNKFCNDNNINLLRIRYDEDHVSVLKEYFKNNFNIEL